MYDLALVGESVLVGGHIVGWLVNMSLAFWFDVGAATGAEVQLEAAEPLSVRPNPTTSTLHVAVPGGAGTPLDVVDLLGRTVLSGIAESGTWTADVRRLAPGVYVVRAGERALPFTVGKAP